MLIFDTAAILTGFILDMLIGDPRGIPHIVIGMGKLIAALEKALRKVFLKTPQGERLAGSVLVIIMLFICTLLPLCIFMALYRLSPWAGMAAEALICWQLIAAKDLKTESMAVYERLSAHDLPGARRAVSMIVGRDTAALDETGVTKAAVETVAENTSDGVIAPLFYMLLGGGVLGCMYKAVNTMDSMVGYKNERYIDFGRTAAKLDDALNFIPARLSAELMILACRITGLNAVNARRIYLRDRYNHASPNSAHTEAVCAGALGVRLAGDAYYFGKLHKKPCIGDDIRPVEAEDIRRANKLMMATSALMLVLILLIRAIVIGGTYYAAL